ncbi:MAG TPA: hypothetical protein VJZ71_19645 [Phycisphaerae bacterium]|nr:hypothetical protein [Phycisphaerae bacterium]
MRSCVFAVLGLVALSANTSALEDPPQGSAEFDKFVTYYYLDKDTSSVVNFLKWLQESEMLDDNASALTPTAAFLAIVFADNPSEVGRFAKSADFTGRTKEAVQIALWRSGHAKKVAEIFGEMPAFAKKKPVNLKKKKMKGPGDLDMMWGAFLASGDVVYVKKVIDVLDEKHPLSGDATKDEVTRGAAEWSLKSNMIQHELVYRLIHKESMSRTGDVKKKLQEMVSYAKPKDALPHKDGPFSADLYVMADKEMAEFDKPVDDAPRIGHKSTAKRGDIVGIKIVFGGIELADDLNANVTYDLKILNPDGDVYEEADLKDLEALSGKIPTRFRVFDNRLVIKIRFEPHDKLGVYKISATIRDKIGDKSVSLTREIELKG